jgi:ATP-dependent RNA circularization protein (DNA/RNA ligase family)
VLKSQPWIEEWCRAHEDYVLWGEVTPTQKGYEYGSKDPQLFVFDVRHPDGHWLSYDKEDESVTLQQLWTRSVPMLFFKVPYSKEGIMKIVDGISYVHGATNMREGVVIKAFPERHVRGVGRAQLKIVSKVFLEKDNK